MAASVDLLDLCANCSGSSVEADSGFSKAVLNLLGFPDHTSMIKSCECFKTTQDKNKIT